MKNEIATDITSPAGIEAVNILFNNLGLIAATILLSVVIAAWFLAVIVRKKALEILETDKLNKQETTHNKQKKLTQKGNL